MKFSFTDEEFLEILNNICRKEITSETEYLPLTSMQDEVAADRLDSLGVIMFFVWISELFGIPEEDVNNFITQEVFTVQELKDFTDEKHTQIRSYEAYLEYVEEISRI